MVIGAAPETALALMAGCSFKMRFNSTIGGGSDNVEPIRSFITKKA